MLDVKIRPTARIPIVQFVDRASGAHCDVSFSNSLAVSNTLLLRTYSEIDPRIRPLAYIIKHWARSRHINSPADGTLSSYGYVICLLHFLQNRPVPLVPNLQRIPSDWTGQGPPSDLYLSGREGEINPTDGSFCSTYFYRPGGDVRKANLLSNFARNNKESLAKLLGEFFAYFAWHFDFNNFVVSLQSGKEKATSKLQKAEADGWPKHDRLRCVRQYVLCNVHSFSLYCYSPSSDSSQDFTLFLFFLLLFCLTFLPLFLCSPPLTSSHSLSLSLSFPPSLPLFPYTVSRTHLKRGMTWPTLSNHFR
jgi:TUTase nucleotidyltransferase domain/Cid1 family poly A polymerase